MFMKSGADSLTKATRQAGPKVRGGRRCTRAASLAEVRVRSGEKSVRGEATRPIAEGEIKTTEAESTGLIVEACTSWSSTSRALRSDQLK